MYASSLSDYLAYCIVMSCGWKTLNIQLNHCTSSSCHNNYCNSLSQSHFKPELPEDTVIHFHINCSKLVLTILSVLHTSKPVAANSSVVHVVYSTIASLFNPFFFYKLSNAFQVGSVL